MNLIDLKRLSILEVKESLISPDMERHIQLWNDILAGNAPWNKEARCSGVIDSIAGAIDDNVAEEMSVTSENERLAEAMDDLTSHASDIVQYMCLCGGCVVRPVYAGRLKFEILQLGNYIPTSYDLDGTLTGAVLIKDFSEGGKDYALVEKHHFDGSNENVRVMLYEKKGDTYTQRPLSSTSKTEELTEEFQYNNIDRPMIVEFRSRKTNNIDGSRVPVAIYSGRENLLEDADRQYCRINWEQEAGEKRVFASADLFRARQGEAIGAKTSVTPALQKLLVRINDSGATGDKIQEYSPNLRTDAQLGAFQEILRRIEICCKLGKGTISDLDDVRMTATQYQGGKKVLYTTVDSYESELETKYRHVAWIFAYLLSAYERIPFNPEIIVSYNDAARKDPDQMRLAALQELTAGIISKAEYRMRIFGEDEETALEKVPAAEPVSFGGLFN